MFKVLDKLRVGDIYCISIEGDIQLLKNGLKLIDDKKNIYEISNIGMPHYKNAKDFRKYAEITLLGNVDNIGETLFIMK